MKNAKNRNLKVVVVASLAAVALKSGAAIAEVRPQTQQALQELDARLAGSSLILAHNHNEQGNNAFRLETCCGSNC